MNDFDSVEAIVLGPLEGRSSAEWERSPSGKWTPAQIVEHLTLGFEWCLKGFDDRRNRPPMTRRPRTLIERGARVLIFHVGWVPAVRAASATTPTSRPDPIDIERRFRAAAAGLRRLAGELLPARATYLFVKHPRMGDLTLSEWLRFHAWHCRHHARQIRARVEG